MLKQIRLVVVVLLIGAIYSCQKKEIPQNPFEQYTPVQDTVNFVLEHPDSSTFAGLYTYIFKPTCANVGCHDGTFEPDFRSLESSYHSLVFQQSIKNDGGHPFRVQPFSPDNSGLLARITGEILPWMPIQLEPDSDWAKNKDKYISLIRQWILDGSPSIDGVIPGNAHPGARLLGAMAIIGDTAMIQRGDFGGPMKLDSLVDTVRLYLAFGHNGQNPLTFSQHTLIIDTLPHVFGSEAPEFALEKLSTPRWERGFQSDIVPFQYWVDLPTKSLFPGAKKFYLKSKIKDDFHPLTMIPGEKALYNLKQYMSFERIY
jgi:hypothetical protein